MPSRKGYQQFTVIFKQSVKLAYQPFRVNRMFDNIYGDYYRFTEEALKYLFKRFEHIEIKKQGGIFRALMFFSPWQNKTRFIWEPMTYILDKLFKTERRTTTAGYYIYAIK